MGANSSPQLCFTQSSMRTQETVIDALSQPGSILGNIAEQGASLCNILPSACQSRQRVRSDPKRQNRPSLFGCPFSSERHADLGSVKLFFTDLGSRCSVFCCSCCFDHSFSHFRFAQFASQKKSSLSTHTRNHSRLSISTTVKLNVLCTLCVLQFFAHFLPEYIGCSESDVVCHRLFRLCAYVYASCQVVVLSFYNVPSRSVS